MWSMEKAKLLYWWILNLNKANEPVCDPAAACGHFLIFSSIDEANDKKPYDNLYKHIILNE